MNFIACIATASDLVSNGYCDIAVGESDLVSCKEADDGTEIPVYGMSNRLVMGPIETTVSTDDDDKLTKAQNAGEDILANNGWEVVGGWDIVDNAMYATVEQV